MKSPSGLAWIQSTIRMKNIFVEGDISYWGEQLHAVGLKETLVKATEAIDWGKTTTAPTKPGVKIGKGFACIQKPTRSPTTSNAGVTVNAQGEVTVLAGTVEIGQGCNTILSQVAAEELKVPMEKVLMHQLDTDVIPYDASTTSSRSTYHMGNAVRSAAIHAREQIMEAASPMLEAKVQDLDFGDGKVFLKDQPSRRCRSAKWSSASSASTASSAATLPTPMKSAKTWISRPVTATTPRRFTCMRLKPPKSWSMRRAAGSAYCACPPPTMSARRSIRSIASRKSKAASPWASARRCTKR